MSDTLPRQSTKTVLVCSVCRNPAPADGSPCPADGNSIFVTESLSDWDGNEKTAPILDPVLGQELSGFKVVEQISAGGMGVVYRGVHPELKNSVAIKVLRREYAQSPEAVESMLKEAQAVSASRHRNVVEVFGFGRVADGRTYVIMEYLEGEALDDVLASKGSLSPLAAVDVLLDITAPLIVMHRLGIVHRDIKPSNIFWVRDSDGERVMKLVDFGLAKRLKSNAPLHQTTNKVLFGTPHYMAPEMIKNGSSGATTDIYSIGVLAYEMLTGKLPYDAANAMDVMLAHLNTPTPRVSARVPSVPPALDDLVASMMAKDAADRPASVDKLRTQLKAIRGSFFVEAPPRLTDPNFQPRRGRTPSPRTVRVRLPRSTLVAGFIGTFILGAAAVFLLQRGDRSPSPTEEPAPAPAAISPPVPEPTVVDAPPAPVEPVAAPAPEPAPPPEAPAEPPPPEPAPEAPKRLSKLEAQRAADLSQLSQLQAKLTAGTLGAGLNRAREQARLEELKTRIERARTADQLRKEESALKAWKKRAETSPAKR